MFAEQILDGLDTLTLPELKEVQAHVNALVATIEEWQRPNDQVVETRVVPGGCLRLEWVKCGKERCKKCAAGGTGHGPYWYLYQWRGGRRRKVYIGKEKPGDSAI